MFFQLARPISHFKPFDWLRPITLINFLFVVFDRFFLKFLYWINKNICIDVTISCFMAKSVRVQVQASKSQFSFYFCSEQSFYLILCSFCLFVHQSASIFYSLVFQVLWPEVFSQHSWSVVARSSCATHCMSLVMRKPVFALCQQRRRRSACASVQSDQRLCYLLLDSTISLGLPKDFGSILKKGGGGGFLALKSHIICSSKKSCMKIKVNIMCFSLNSIFLID